MKQLLALILLAVLSNSSDASTQVAPKSEPAEKAALCEPIVRDTVEFMAGKMHIDGVESITRQSVGSFKHVTAMPGGIVISRDDKGATAMFTDLDKWTYELIRDNGKKAQWFRFEIVTYVDSGICDVTTVQIIAVKPA